MISHFDPTAFATGKVSQAGRFFIIFCGQMFGKNPSEFREVPFENSTGNNHLIKLDNNLKMTKLHDPKTKKIRSLNVSKLWVSRMKKWSIRTFSGEIAWEGAFVGQERDFKISKVQSLQNQMFEKKCSYHSFVSWKLYGKRSLSICWTPAILAEKCSPPLRINQMTLQWFRVSFLNL